MLNENKPVGTEMTDPAMQSQSPLEVYEIGGGRSGAAGGNASSVKSQGSGWISLFGPDEPKEQNGARPGTEQWYYEQLNAFRNKPGYRQGDPWGNEKKHQWILKSILNFQACGAFCTEISDLIFGNPQEIPVYYEKVNNDCFYSGVIRMPVKYEFDNLMPTDIIQLDYPTSHPHLVTVLRVNRQARTVNVCEGNCGGKVNWNSQLSEQHLKDHAKWILSRILKVDRQLCQIPHFEDLEEHPHGTAVHDAIEWAYTHSPQMTAGTDATHFSPEEVVTRATIMTFLWAAAGKPKPKTPESSIPFTDVKPGKWYTKAVLWAYENRITSGKTDGSFGINDKCKVTHMLSFLYAQQGKPSFDASAVPAGYVEEGQYYTKAVKWAYVKGIARSNGKFNPYTACTRAIAALYLYRALEGEYLILD